MATNPSSGSAPSLSPQKPPNAGSGSGAHAASDKAPDQTQAPALCSSQQLAVDAISSSTGSGSGSGAPVPSTVISTNPSAPESALSSAGSVGVPQSSSPAVVDVSAEPNASDGVEWTPKGKDQKGSDRSQYRYWCGDTQPTAVKGVMQFTAIKLKSATFIVRVGNTVFVEARTKGYDQGRAVVVAELRRVGIQTKSMKNFALIARKGATTLKTLLCGAKTPLRSAAAPS